MTNEPIVIQQGSRKAIINGSRVSLLKVRNKQKDESKFPDADIEDPAQRWKAAALWVENGFADLPEFQTPRRYYQ